MSFGYHNAGPADLDAVNAVIEAAIDGWPVADRVKRLVRPLYRYGIEDLDHLHITQCYESGVCVGVVAWGEAGPEESIGRGRESLLHGIYVLPDAQHRGIGRDLFAYARGNAERLGFDGFIVKASKNATGFFENLGLERVQNADVRYPYLFWKSIRAPEEADRSRLVEMAWEDRTPFEAIEAQYGLSESGVIRLMRRELKPSSFRLWRKRVTGRATKHRELRHRGVIRGYAPGQYKR